MIDVVGLPLPSTPELLMLGFTVLDPLRRKERFRKSDGFLFRSDGVAAM
jgi:hypothetical protein